jgi:hypothetical protein
VEGTYLLIKLDDTSSGWRRKGREGTGRKGMKEGRKDGKG